MDAAILNRRLLGGLVLFSVGVGIIPTATVWAQDAALVANLSTPQRFVLPGQPVWVEFSIANVSGEPVELSVPDTQPTPSAGVMGLPLAHVFSGHAFAGLSIQGGTMGRVWDVATGYHPPASAEVLTLAPDSSVGVRLDATQFYPVLRTPGRFRLTWSPYSGSLVSNELIIEVATHKQALIQTDHGNMTMRFLYDLAPHHVENFLELARDGFYDNLIFHRIVPGYWVQTGCSQGDGTGIRPDGRKLVAELSDRPIDRGSACMARLEDDLNSASSQFMICATRLPMWDGRYTVFAELVGEESFATLDRLMSQPTSPDGRPLQKVYVRAIRIVDAPRSPQRPPAP